MSLFTQPLPDSHSEVSDAPEVGCSRQGAEHVIVDGVAVDDCVLGQVPGGNCVLLTVVVIPWTLDVVVIHIFSLVNGGLGLTGLTFNFIQITS